MIHGDEPHDGSRPSLTVASCLGAGALATAVVVCGAERLESAVTWVAVIEWPIDNFVSPGDFILTTGMGCNAEQLAVFVEQAARRGAVAVCLAVGVHAHHPAVPAVVEDSARRHGVVLVSVPWEVRFSDISRTIIETLYVQPSQSGTVHEDDLPSAFTRALLDTGGLHSVAGALEGVTGLPALILDVAGVVIGHGPLAEEMIAAPTAQPNLLGALHSRIDGSAKTSLQRIGDETQSTLVAPIRGRQRALGWVVVSDPADATAPVPGDLEGALRHGATACAIELLRQEAAEEFGSRARGQFIWWVTGAEAISTDELAARSALLGYPLNAELRVALGLVEVSDRGAASVNVAADTARRLRLRLQYPTSVVTHRDSEILVCLDRREPDLQWLLDDTALTPFADRVTWGLAGGVHRLSDLPEAAARARTAVAVARATLGPGKLACADQLGPLMLLNGLASDQLSTNLAGEVIGPLEGADRERGSDLLGTLAVYLAENGNVSSAARRLHLNRHSLIYRLHRIEALTGRSLDSHEDRLLLDISMRLRRLQSTHGK